MRIGIDCRTILNPKTGERAGVGYYTYYLVKNLLEIDKDNLYVLFFDNRFTKFDLFKQKNVKMVTFPFYQYKKYLPLAYSHILISAILDKENLDVFHSPANILPLLYSKTSVVTIHDLAIYKYPNLFPNVNRQSFAIKTLVPKTVTKADRIIAVSKNTKSDIIEEFGVPEERIEVVYEGITVNDKSCLSAISFEKIKEKFGIEDKYFLFIGTIEPRKNLVNLINAFRNLRLAYDSPAKDYQLIIAGSRGWSDQAVFDSISDTNASLLGDSKKRGGIERRSGFDLRDEKEVQKVGERRSNRERRKGLPVKYISYISDEEKTALICNAKAFVFPSLYEGFGLPVLEAMSMGVPVITSDNSSLSEVVTKKAGLLVDPEKDSEIAEALSQIITDQGLSESLGIEAINRSKDFSWKDCAMKTLEIYKDVVLEKKK